MTDKYDGRCLECKHWGGDQLKVYRDIESSGDIVMDKDKGWAVSGACALDLDWCDSEVDCGRYCQGGSATIEVYAHFGCIYWQKLESKAKDSRI